VSNTARPHIDRVARSLHQQVDSCTRRPLRWEKRRRYVLGSEEGSQAAGTVPSVEISRRHVHGQKRH